MLGLGRLGSGGKGWEVGISRLVDARGEVDGWDRMFIGEEIGQPESGK